MIIPGIVAASFGRRCPRKAQFPARLNSPQPRSEKGDQSYRPTPGGRLGDPPALPDHRGRVPSEQCIPRSTKVS